MPSTRASSRAAFAPSRSEPAQQSWRTPLTGTLLDGRAHRSDRPVDVGRPGPGGGSRECPAECSRMTRTDPFAGLPSANCRGGHSDRPSKLLLCDVESLSLSPEISAIPRRLFLRVLRSPGVEAPVRATPRKLDEHLVDEPVLKRGGETRLRRARGLRHVARRALYGRCPGVAPRTARISRAASLTGDVSRLRSAEHPADVWASCGRDFGRPRFRRLGRPRLKRRAVPRAVPA